MGADVCGYFQTTGVYSQTDISLISFSFLEFVMCRKWKLTKIDDSSVSSVSTRQGHCFLWWTLGA